MAESQKETKRAAMHPKLAAIFMAFWEKMKKDGDLEGLSDDEIISAVSKRCEVALKRFKSFVDEKGAKKTA